MGPPKAVETPTQKEVSLRSPTHPYPLPFREGNPGDAKVTLGLFSAMHEACQFTH